MLLTTTGQTPAFTVSPDRVDLWSVHRPGTAPPDRSDLDTAETARADAFARPADAALYVTAHVALRRILGRYTRQPPRQVRFVREPCPGCGAAHGRPALDPNPRSLHFSLSHSRDTALIGVAAVPVGVDVQKPPRPETVRFCSHAMHPREQHELAAIPEDERGAQFGRIWTRKEAYLKGLGTGLRHAPAADYVGAEGAHRVPGWTLIDIPCGPALTAAAAVRGPAPAVLELRRLPAAWLGADPPDER
ncbi:4'-phosphopantetheinyl transferase family protein [Streptomyces albidoflavus]